MLDSISTLWSEAKERAIVAVNTELLDTNWRIGQYIVEYEQEGKSRAEYGKQLLTQLAKDLTIRHGKGFNRSNLTYMRRFYKMWDTVPQNSITHIMFDEEDDDENVDELADWG